MSDIDLQGLEMRVTSVASIGGISEETSFRFEQKGRVVSARYRGGLIEDGFLVGRLDGQSLHFRYVQITACGRIDSGVSQGQLDLLPDGRLRLTEDFQWETRAGFGTNIFEEC